MRLRIKKNNPDAIVPTYATDGAACFDLYALESGSIPAGRALTFRTGIAVEIPKGWRMDIFSRSGQGFKEGIRLANSVGKIDSDYRGEILVRLHNDSLWSRTINAGDRIAQAELNSVMRVEFVQVESLTETARGSGGFGSTGA